MKTSVKPVAFLSQVYFILQLRTTINRKDYKVHEGDTSGALLHHRSWMWNICGLRVDMRQIAEMKGNRYS